MSEEATSLTEEHLNTIREFIRTGLSRNNYTIVVLCQGLLLPETVETRHFDIGFRNIALASHIRQDDLPIYVEGDPLIVYLKTGATEESRHPKDI